MIKLRLISIMILLIVVGCSANVDEKPALVEKHDCVELAGYTWCVSKQECILLKEDDCPGTDDRSLAISLATEFVEEMEEYRMSNGRDLSILDIDEANCPGCFIVIVSFTADSRDEERESDNYRVTLTIIGWEISDVVYNTGHFEILNIEECLQKDGRVGTECLEDEAKIGRVDKEICCIRVTSFEECVSLGYPILETYPEECRIGDKSFFNKV